MNPDRHPATAVKADVQMVPVREIILFPGQTAPTPATDVQAIPALEVLDAVSTFFILSKYVFLGMGRLF